MNDQGLRAALIVGACVVIVVALTFLALWLRVPFLPPLVPVGALCYNRG
jgi:xanthine/uracil permease